MEIIFINPRHDISTMTVTVLEEEKFYVTEIN